MNLEQYNRRLQSLAENTAEQQTARIIVPAASRLLGNIKNRIQRRGQRTDGGNIGSYSTRPFYASRSQFVKKSAFIPQGKNGRRKTAKTMYLQHGYKQLRDIQGRPTDVVNFTYTGDLMASYQLAQETKRVLLGLTSEVQSRKRKALEKRFGSVLSATKQELQEYSDEVADELKQFTLRTITGFTNV